MRQPHAAAVGSECDPSLRPREGASPREPRRRSRRAALAGSRGGRVTRRRCGDRRRSALAARAPVVSSGSGSPEAIRAARPPASRGSDARSTEPQGFVLAVPSAAPSRRFDRSASGRRRGVLLAANSGEIDAAPGASARRACVREGTSVQLSHERATPTSACDPPGRQRMARAGPQRPQGLQILAAELPRPPTAPNKIRVTRKARARSGGADGRSCVLAPSPSTSRAPTARRAIAFVLPVSG